MYSVLLLMALALDPWQQTAKDIFRQLIEINTQDSDGDVTKASNAMAQRFRKAGWDEKDIAVVGDVARRKSMVVRYRGTGKRKPILIVAHLDCVEAKREDWRTDPFQLIEIDGQYYGRGTVDDKNMASAFVANFLRYKSEGFQPDRDLILALTAGEESHIDNGISYLIAKRRDLIEAAFAINEVGGAQMLNGKKLFVGAEAAEKSFITFHLTTKNAGGHSSVPSKDNAIYHLAMALTKLQAYEFPPRLTEVTQAYFERMASIVGGATGRDMSLVPDKAAMARLSQSPFYNAQLRTTCVVTMINGGHAQNALPQAADATVNCRALPGDTIDSVQKTLADVVADPAVAITQFDEVTIAPASTLSDDAMAPIRATAAEMWPGIPVIPTMLSGGTDGRYLRKAGIPTYGVNGLFLEQSENRLHGRDERVPVASYFESQEFLYRLVKKLGSTL